jgi:hypothetical protein
MPSLAPIQILHLVCKCQKSDWKPHNLLPYSRNCCIKKNSQDSQVPKHLGIKPEYSLFGYQLQKINLTKNLPKTATFAAPTSCGMLITQLSTGSLQTLYPQKSWLLSTGTQLHLFFFFLQIFLTNDSCDHVGDMIVRAWPFQKLQHLSYFRHVLKPCLKP